VQDNPKLSARVRLFAAAVVLVLAAGTVLLFYPSLMRPHWPWQLAPFNARFLGAFYTAEMAAILMMGIVNRWSPARLVLIMAVCFTVIVSVVSLWHIERFNFERWAPWGWFFVYVGSALAAAAFVWSNRGLPHPGRAFASPGLRVFLVVQAATLGLYGLALMAAPEWAAGFWPWRLDRFHAQVYSAIFITAGLGAYLLSRTAAGYELAALGLGLGIFGGGAVLGLWLANGTRQVIHWNAPGTMFWIAGFALVAAFGLVNLALAARKVE
jgi:hypothetical protein